ncbi:peptidase [Massilia eurypsychrophila]|uniref:Peptidase n=1 Tax=Massilia eurypsychrophila TaxID=1485217 RepID=A0A2G8TGK7_9BURK|nr:PA domain-containing protein [Massilia eurypsychrophila]PIL44758.1 peptidase [Massilia eurypsychrophila]
MRKINSLSLKRTLVAAAGALVCLSAQAVTSVVVAPAKATIIISSRDPVGFGFNDTTPVAPVGGNPGTTLGAQRYNVYRYVADIWEQNLQSPVDINVSAGWEALPCTANSATLGSASAFNLWHDFPGGAPGTWYPQALANKLAGVNLSADTPDDGSGYGNVDIKTQFNINLGNPDCLSGSGFYLGFDGKAGAQVNFVATLLHELGHGLGFSVLSVNTSSGLRINAEYTAYTTTGLPSIWERFMYDNTAKKTWLTMTSAERKASAINPLQLAWIGPNVAAAQGLLKAQPALAIATPAPGASGLYQYNPSPFGAAITTPSALGRLAVIADQAGSLGPACAPFNAANIAAVAGKVPVISRGGCTFAIKVKNAQDAGAIGVLLANNAAGALNPGGADATISIPSAGITMADGDKLKAAVIAARPYGSRSAPGSVTATWSVDTSRIAGADAQGRPLLYTPNPLIGGSSVSHWDVSASPNLLMEPNISSDLGIILTAPKDLTVPLLKDLGW